MHRPYTLSSRLVLPATPPPESTSIIHGFFSNEIVGEQHGRLVVLL